MRFALLLVAVTQLYAGRCPAQDMPLSQVLVAGAEWELVAQGYHFTEAPRGDGRGNLFFVDVPQAKIFRLDAAGKISEFVADSGKASGLAVGPPGRLYAAQSGAKRIVWYDEAGRETVLCGEVEPNDLAVTRTGHVYFTDFAGKKIWHVDPQGVKRVVDEGLDRPNGIGLWADDQTLVVSEFGGRHVWAFRIEPNGDLAFKQPYYPLRLPRLQSESGADGLCFDQQGRLYVATHEGVQMFDPTGRLSGVIAKPQPKFLSSAGFGGPEGKHLYVTSSDRLYRRATQATGRLPAEK